MFSLQQSLDTTSSTTSTIAGSGLIAIDEHTSVACMIDVVTPTGLSLTLLDGLAVPASFVLFTGSQARVCHVVRRTEEGIEAAFADRASPERAARMPAPTLRLGTVRALRRSESAQALRRAA